MKLNKRKRSVTTELFFTYFLGYVTFTIILLLTIFCSIVSYGLISTLPTYNTVFKNLDSKLNEHYTTITNEDLVNVNGFLVKINNKNQIEYYKGNVIDDFKNITLENYMSIFGVKKNNEDNLNDDLRAFFLMDNFNSSIIQTKNKTKYCLYSKYLNEENALLVMGCPYSQAIKPNKITKIIPNHLLIKTISFLNITILLLIVYVFAKITSKSYVKPIKILLNGVIELSKGNYDIRININKKNEFLELSNGFNMMAETIQKERSEKEKLEKTRKDLMLDISHDLKNPLSSILGYSETLINNHFLDEHKRLEYLEIINKNSYRSNQLINDLFEFSLYENSNYNLNLIKTDICEFLRRLIANYIPEFEHKNFKYDFDITEDSYYILIDEEKLSRAINNILDNKIKYNKEGANLFIKTEVKNTYFYITLSDDGESIPKEYKENIFNAFVRVDKSRNSKTGGTGLGLSITKKILNKHNGDIRIIDSEIGTSFEIKLPIIR